MLTGCISVQFDPDGVVVSDFVVGEKRDLSSFRASVAIDTPLNFLKNVESSRGLQIDGGNGKVCSDLLDEEKNSDDSFIDNGRAVSGPRCLIKSDTFTQSGNVRR
jgi:hypothetical protein